MQAQQQSVFDKHQLILLQSVLQTNDGWPSIHTSTRGSNSNNGGGLSRFLQDISAVLFTPTFVVIILQGIVGSTPWKALAFGTLYFQLMGWGDGATSMLMGVFGTTGALGGLLGGWLGDIAAQKYPNHGRVAVCQFSVGVGVPLALIVFQGLPMSSGSDVYLLYGGMMAVMGLTITWAATACNNPIFAEIVPPDLRSLVYAFDRSFEGAISAMGAPLVGLLAERVFHFQGTAATQGECMNAAW